MLELTRYSPQICCVTKLLSETARKKSTKADVIKRLMREQKATFGALLETKQEKNRRLKLEKKGVIAPVNVVTGGDSELAWMLRVSDSRLRLVKLDQNYEMPQKVDIDCTKEDKELSKFQTRIIRKTSVSKAKKSKITPSESVVFADNNLKETQINKKCTVQRNVKSKKPDSSDSFTEDKTNLKETEIECQREEKDSSILLPHKKTKETDAKTNPKETEIECQREEKDSSILLPRKEMKETDPETNPKETEIEYHREVKISSILLPREKILENISKALLYQEDKIMAESHSSDILSISPMDNEEYFKFPSVTRILNATMSENAKKMLELWMARMIRQLGENGFNEYKQGLIQNGKLLHSAIDSHLRKQPLEVPENLRLCFDSVKIVLDEVQNVRVIESQVVHQNLGYRGVADCVALYRGNLCLIDWKKSDKTKHLLSATYDAPLQIASYIGALNADPNYPFQIHSGLLVIAYTVGNPPTVFSLDEKKLQYYWKQWLARLKKYYTMQNT